MKIQWTRNKTEDPITIKKKKYKLRDKREK